MTNDEPSGLAPGRIAEVYRCSEAWGSLTSTMPFASLGLSQSLVRAVVASNYHAPTEVQKVAIPSVLDGRDVRASAATGAGKTAAYVLPLLQRLMKTVPTKPRPTYVLILVPTRELAAQVGREIEKFEKFLPQPVKSVVAFGGVSINPQMMDLRGGAEVVVATPGRLLDLVEHNALHLNQVGTLVLDEADRMLDLGFAQEVDRILALLPRRRQNLLFSATYPEEVEKLAQGLLHDPVRIAVENEAAEKPDIVQRAIEVDDAQRGPLLRHLIKTEKWPRALVFVASQHSAEHVAGKLINAGIRATAFHGDMSQGARTRALEDIKDLHITVLVATDLAARGLDIVELPVVVNYDLPRSTDDYLHRIGRTGRAGEKGMAVSFVTAGTHAHFRLIEKRNDLQVAREQVPGFEPTELEPPPQPAGGGIKGKRLSKKDKLRAEAARRAAME